MKNLIIISTHNGDFFIHIRVYASAFCNIGVKMVHILDHFVSIMYIHVINRGINVKAKIKVKYIFYGFLVHIDRKI